MPRPHARFAVYQRHVQTFNLRLTDAAPWTRSCRELLCSALLCSTLSSVSWFHGATLFRCVDSCHRNSTKAPTCCFPSVLPAFQYSITRRLARTLRLCRYSIICCSCYWSWVASVGCAFVASASVHATNRVLCLTVVCSSCLREDCVGLSYVDKSLNRWTEFFGYLNGEKLVNCRLPWCWAGDGASLCSSACKSSAVSSASTVDVIIDVIVVSISNSSSITIEGTTASMCRRQPPPSPTRSLVKACEYIANHYKCQRRIRGNFWDLVQFLIEQIVHLLLRQLILVNKADHWQVLRIGTLAQSADTRDLPIPS